MPFIWKLEFDIQKTFNEIVEKEKTVSLPVVAVKVYSFRIINK